MAVLSGHHADLYIAAGPSTAFTDEVCALVSGTTYQITDTAKRHWDPSASFTVEVSGIVQDSSSYELIWASGKIVFKTAPGGIVTVSGAYLTLSQAGQAYNWSLEYGPELATSTVFGSSWVERTAVISDGSGSFERFYLDEEFHTSLGNYFVMALYVNQPSGARFLAVGKLNPTINVRTGELITENVSFSTHGGIDYAAS